VSTKQKIFIADARRAAHQICGILQDACERIEIAGSIRRMLAMVGDIEIVCRPKLLMGHRSNFISAIDELLDEIIPIDGTLFAGDVRDKGLRWNNERPTNGTRYKRLIWVGQEGPLERIPVDLFCVLPPASWGALMAIRTGPADFSKGLVTKRRQGGAMPDELLQRDGALWGPEGRVETPEEEDYFRLLGIPCWAPEGRTAERLEEHLTGSSPAGE
jgi:DNA polymerase/3'-5' exonuclease PolX